jgi:tyrosyl-tRNA synthetase
MGSPESSRLLAGADQVIPVGGLEQKLALGRPLRVKLGLDPTAADVTLGWAVVLRKLRQFQDAGHVPVLIVGDFTARVGDPSGKSETRPRLTKDEVDGYAEHLLAQFGKILDMERVELRRNSEWLEPMGMEDILKLTASYTVARMLEREDFAKRYRENRPISMMEFMYPLLQAYDSVAVQADIEMGGTDQLFNLLVGRDTQRDWGQDPQVALTMPLLEGLDGVQKMSQSLGNYVGITEPANEVFGKLMSIPDALIGRYLLLCTDTDPADVEMVESGLASGSLHPGEQKRALARSVVDIYWGAGAGGAAEEHFNLVHREREVPDDVEEKSVPAVLVDNGRVWVPKLLVALGMAASNAEARRLIEQEGVRLGGHPVTPAQDEVALDDLRGKVLQVGRRKFVKLT